MGAPGRHWNDRGLVLEKRMSARIPTRSDSPRNPRRKGRGALRLPPHPQGPWLRFPRVATGGTHTEPAAQEPAKPAPRRRAAPGRDQAWLRGKQAQAQRQASGQGVLPGPGMTHCAFPVGTQTGPRDRPPCRRLPGQGFGQDALALCPFVSGTGQGLEPLLRGPLRALAFPRVAGHVGVHCLQDGNPPRWKMPGGVPGTGVPSLHLGRQPVGQGQGQGRRMPPLARPSRQMEVTDLSARTGTREQDVQAH